MVKPGNWLSDSSKIQPSKRSMGGCCTSRLGRLQRRADLSSRNESSHATKASHDGLFINKLREGDEIHGVVGSRGRNRQGAV